MARQQWGWGAGLYGMLVNTYYWARERYSFDHFVSMDYDALFVREGADACLLRDAEREATGLVGVVTTMGKAWKQLFEARWPLVMKLTQNRAPEDGWEKHTVYGAVMLLTREALVRMEEAGYFEDPVKNCRDTVKIADDPWITFLVKSLGLAVVNAKPYCYNVWKHPEKPEIVMNRDPGIRMWHPAKMGQGGGQHDYHRERICRNYFRALRGRKPLA